ncbi:MAG: hypothetical protein U0641_16945 [Anaerolineae bacterium]
MNNSGTTGYPLTCDQASQILATTAGGAFDPTQWALAEAHLAACPRCHEAADKLADAILALSAIEDLESAWGMARAARAAKEASAATPSRPFRWDALGRFIIQFSADLLASLQPTTPKLSYGLKSPTGQKVLYTYQLTQDNDDLDVAIGVEESRDDPTRCTVIVSVQIPSLGGWPNLAGTGVTVRRGDEGVAEGLTDAYGDAVFARIPVADLPDLSFEITPVA